MAEPMQVRVEVWPVAADETGIWLLSGDDAWRPATTVAADSEPHFEVELTLSNHRALDQVAVLHSTSWRVDGPAVVLTYVALLDVPDAVRLTWPDARPVSAAAVNAVGPAPAHQPAGPPAPRYIDVLKHAIRHLAFLRDTDETTSGAFPEYWARHLTSIRPALAGMYSSTPAAH
jgi:hypothetical protein